MNKKGNTHYQNTHSSIQQALLTLLETDDLSRISVRKICDLAQINRSTFYTHYSSIEDLLNEIDSLLRIDHLRLFEDHGISGFDFLNMEGLMLTLCYIRQHKNFYRTYIRQMQRLEYLEEYFEELWSNHTAAPFWNTKYKKEEMFYKNLYFMGGSLKIIEFWLQQDCADSIETVSDLIAKLVPVELLPQHTPAP